LSIISNFSYYFDNETSNLDDIFERIYKNSGEILNIKGLGKYQLFHFLTVVSGVISSALIFHNIYLYEFEPHYLCSTNTQDWKSCKKQEMCSNEFTGSYKYDYTQETSIHNWIE